MIKIAVKLVVIMIFLSIPGSVLAVYNFDYFFGSTFVPTQRVISATVPVESAIVTVAVSPTPAQILAMQANLNQIRANLALLTSRLANSNSNANTTIVVKEPQKVVIARGIPLVLQEQVKKKDAEEDKTLSVFASLIPPDVRNFPLITTYFVVLTLGLLGVITYLFFTRRKEKKHTLLVNRISK